MPNSFESDGRGPSDRQLLLAGVAMAVVGALVAGALLIKSTGRFDDYVRVLAELTNVGDGLPAKSDVKFQGVLVGSVTDVTPSQRGRPNVVHINLKSGMAQTVPRNVTARVVPSNVFAVSSVELVDHGPGGAITDGTVIGEDTELPTVLFQTTISKLRDILLANGRGRDDDSVGVFAVIAAATEGRRATLLNAAGQLTRLIDQLNGLVATDTGPSTLSALMNATRGLQSTAPDLVDALHQAIKPMQTLAEKREQLQTLLNAGLHTTGTVRQSLDNQTDRMIDITTKLTPVVGVLAQNSVHFLPIATRLKVFSDKFFSDVWDPENDVVNIRAVASFTPSTMYTRADCPQYGELKGPSCFTAPELVVRPDLPETLLPQNFKPPPDLAPPPGTEVGPDGNLIVTGPPLHNPYPNLQDPNPPLPWWQPNPSPRVPGSIDPGDLEPPPGSPGIPAATAPASFGGNVGPVGSVKEREQLGLITGGDASASTQLLLGPVARGTKPVVAQQPSKGGQR
ncbi:Putative Mce family protein [Mycobacteroides abscessus]|uniref:MlaD family protein n=1 Tax=Mycobacteroides abscessus TaxID=36809 RepID=UPI0005E2DE12|nr:MlaD family protein [Mycobacteroides abscessus]CPT98269.1 Putative Mce family protein [Mycobacteroides abscessus]CPX14604.1 Putative Mce family protein [Mycobacteroides abscessus]CPZ99576.1 Putative Mce family protein [Mycobacteroides abscessus]